MCIYLHIYVSLFSCLCMYFVCMCVYISVYIHVCMNIHICIYIYIYIHTHTYIHIHTLYINLFSSREIYFCRSHTLAHPLSHPHTLSPTIHGHNTHTQTGSTIPEKSRHRLRRLRQGSWYFPLSLSPPHPPPPRVPIFTFFLFLSFAFWDTHLYSCIHMCILTFGKCKDVGGLWRHNYVDSGIQAPKLMYEFPDFPAPYGTPYMCEREGRRGCERESHSACVHVFRTSLLPVC